MNDLSDDIQPSTLMVLDGDPAIVEKAVAICSDHQHVLVLSLLPERFQTPAARRAAEGGQPAGILISKNLKFVEVALRVCYEIGPRQALPRKPSHRVELTGKPLIRLLARTDYREVLKKEVSSE